MRNYFLSGVTVIVTIFFITSCGSMEKTAKRSKPGTWQQTPVVIDGQNSDWPNPYPLYDEKAKIVYVISNDKENLYISMQTGDEITVLKILRAGMKLYIDPAGGKEQQVSV